MPRLFCWNVAGWTPTYALIKKDYGSLTEFFIRHNADIVALQEFKMNARGVEEKPHAIGAREEGWDFFMSLYRPSASEAREKAAGTWNGIATICRTGLTIRADPAPLGIPELDNEGRCLLTDHGAFVLFNVYVPASGTNNRHVPWKNIPLKMAFLDALRRAVLAQRALGREVVIAGDFNITRRSVDAFARDRVLHLRRLLREPRAAEDADADADDADGVDTDGGQQGAAYDLPAELQERLVASRSRFREALASVEIAFVPARDKKAPGGGGGFGRASDSYRATAPGPNKGETVKLGSPIESEGLIKAYWGKTGDIVFDPHPISRSLAEKEGSAVGSLRPDRPLVAWRTGWMSVGNIAEVFAKVLGTPLSDADIRALAACGKSPSSPCTRAWIDAVISEDGFVDSFAELYPNAQGRFTAWDQYTNRRYENEGARIDALLVTPGLFAAAGPKKGELGPGGVQPLPSAGRADWESAEAAAAAATSGGQWAPAPFDGSGLAEASQAVLDTQFEGGETGIRYTPPTYSDHVAVTLRLDTAEPAEPLVLKSDKTTLASQPHRQTKTLKSFFAPKGPKGAAGPASAATAAGGAGGSASGAAGGGSGAGAAVQEKGTRKGKGEVPEESNRAAGASGGGEAGPSGGAEGGERAGTGAAMAAQDAAEQPPTIVAGEAAEAARPERGGGAGGSGGDDGGGAAGGSAEDAAAAQQGGAAGTAPPPPNKASTPVKKPGAAAVAAASNSSGGAKRKTPAGGGSGGGGGKKKQGGGKNSAALPAKAAAGGGIAIFFSKATAPPAEDEEKESQ